MVKTLPLSEVKTHLPALIHGVDEREEEVVVTRNGRPAAVLVNYDEYARLKATLEVMSDPELMDQIAKSRQYFRSRRRGIPFEEVFDESPPPKRRQRQDRKRR